MNQICTDLMFKLYPGKVPDWYFKILTDISAIRSKKVINALHEHFVGGMPRTHVCNEYCVCQGYLSIKIKELHLLNRKINELVMQIRKLSESP